MTFWWFSAVFYVIYFTKDASGARILALFPTDLYSHFIVLEEVAKALADRGHQVDVVGQFPLKNPYPNYTDYIDMSGKVPPEVNDTQLKRLINETDTNFYTLAGTNPCLLLYLPEIQKLIKEPPQDPPYDIILVEQFYSNCWFAFGRHMKLPLVGIVSTRLFSYMYEPLGLIHSTSIVPETVEGSSVYMNFWQRFMNTWEVRKLVHEAHAETKIQTLITRTAFNEDMPDVRELERDASLFLANTHFSINGIQSLNPGIVEVGGLHIKDDQSEWPLDLKEYLDESEDGFVYMSFGSILKLEEWLSEETLIALFAGLAKLAPIRVLIKIKSPEKLPTGIPNNVRTFKWIPQIKVLQHRNIRAFVTHGGMLSIMEAVTYAVPLIGFPIYSDQPINVKNCVDRGIAVFLDQRELTGEKIFEAVTEVIHNPNYQKNIKVLSKQFLDRPLPPRDTAVYWIEYILRNGGDSLRSPGIKLTWWQLGLLDVYGSMAAVALMVLCVVTKLISLASFYFTRIGLSTKFPEKKD